MPRDDTDQLAWRDVYQGLRHEIESGLRPPGSDLPTIAELARTTGLSLHGARRVFDKLREEGRVQSWQGKGARVAVRRLRIRISHIRPTFHELAIANGQTSQSQVVSAGTGRLQHGMAARLNRPAGTPVAVTETLRQVDGRTVALSVDYFPADRFASMAELLAQKASISWALAEHGVKTYRRDRTNFEARLPTAHEALMLNIPRSQPVYATMGANIDQRGEFVQFSTGVLRADCVEYEH